MIGGGKSDLLQTAGQARYRFIPFVRLGKNRGLVFSAWSSVTRTYVDIDCR